MLLVGGTYSLTNHNQIFEPVFLPKTIVDLYTPFIPYSIWLYYSYYFIFALSFLLEKDRDYLDRYLWGVIFINLVSVIIFILYPTIIDRNEIVDFRVDFYRNVYSYLYSVDGPANCLPSLHVSISIFSALLFYKRFKLRYFLFMIWAIVISLSTLTTKQHYVLDVITGAILAWSSYWLVFTRLRLRP